MMQLARKFENSHDEVGYKQTEEMQYFIICPTRTRKLCGLSIFGASNI